MHGWFQCLRGKARDEYRKRARGRREREHGRERERGKGNINRVKGGRGRKQKERWRRRLLRQTLARVLNYACNTLNYFNLRARAFFSSVLARERDYATLNS